MNKENTQNGIIWVSSYPKSGNTWLRFILTHLLLNKPGSSHEVDQFIPEAIIQPGHRLDLISDQPVLLKTHWDFSLNLPLMKNTLGFIYIVRNPLDILCSQFNFNRLRLNKDNSSISENELKKQLNLYIDTFISHKGNPLNGDGGGHTSWIEGVNNWLRASESYPCILLRYEDMLEDTNNQIKKIARFFNVMADNKFISEIEQTSSFKSMKRLEEKEIKNKKGGFFYHDSLSTAFKSGNRFMRKGKTGEGRKLLTSDQLSRFVETFEDTMNLVGYKINHKTGAVKLDNLNTPNEMNLPEGLSFTDPKLIQARINY